jgi:tetratricopeptide (TPR) repeat protein
MKQLRTEASARFALGDRYREQGEWAQAAVWYAQAWALVAKRDLAGDGAIPNGWHRMGAVLVQLGREHEAVPYLQRALADYQLRHRRRTQEAILCAIADVHALLHDHTALIATLEALFADTQDIAVRLLQSPEIVRMLQHPEVRTAFDQILATIAAVRTEFSADELPLFGCANCRDYGRGTDGHDWTLECSVCGKCFSYSGCSCDGCCGGTYAGFGGGRTTFSV